MIILLSIVLTMSVILVLAAAVVLYVAYPHRGQDVPAAPWFGDALRRGVESMPTLREPEDIVKRR